MGTTTGTSRFKQWDTHLGFGNYLDCVVPDDGLYSRPDVTLWSRTFTPGQFTIEEYATGLDEGYYHPLTLVYTFPGDHVCWKYSFPIPELEQFEQQGTPAVPRVYWLGLRAEPVGGPEPARFGWKTSTENWNDDAVFSVNQVSWLELRYPSAHPWAANTADLAFEVYGPSGCCVDRVGDANGSGNDEPTIGDISVMIDALFINGDWSVISCLAEADINLSGGTDPQPGPTGDITIGDVSYLIDYLFITGSASMTLPDCF
jgi:hypothetical protein